MSLLPKQLFSVFVLFFIAVKLFSQPANKQAEIKKNMEILDSVYYKIVSRYVEDVKAGEVMKAGANAMLASLDPFSAYLDEKETASAKTVLNANYGGIGCVFFQNEGNIIVSVVREGYAAFKAGITPGDTILSIDAQPVKNKSLDEVIDKILGVAGTDVTIGFKPPGESREIIKTLQRETVKIKAVTYYGMIDNHIGYINLLRETKNCSEEVKQALIDLKTKHQLQGLIFDLRNNEGGYVNEAIKIINLFLKKGDTVLLQRSSKNNISIVSVATDSSVDTNTPIVVLTNENTISAGEIISGAFQDHDRAVIMGSKTYGKGLVQQVYDLPYQTMLKLTEAYYYTPSGRCIESSNYTGTVTSNAGIATRDSSKKMYRTNSGRIVYGYGGIVPDIRFESSLPSSVTSYLYQNNFFFNFALHYKLTHKSISFPRDFHLSDSEYKQFLDFLEDKNIDYKTATEKKLQELKEIASKENYNEDVADAILKLQMQLAANKNKDFIKYRDEIKRELEEQIVAVYYLETGRYQFSLQKDAEIKKAIEILSSQQNYTKILKP